jgi:hypothetical protein
MLVLAISAFLLFVVLTTFKGKQAATEYTQTIQDLSSKVTNVSTEIGAGIFPNADNYTCAKDVGNVPVLTDTGSSIPDNIGDRAPCVFLGRAFQVVPKSGTIYIYTVLGSKDIVWQFLTSNGLSLVQESNPRIAQLSGGVLAMMDTFKMAGGAKILSSSVTTSSGDQPYYLVGLFSSVGGVAPSSGVPELQMIGYPLLDVNSTAPGNTVPNNPGSLVRNMPAGTTVISKWTMCLQNSDNNHTFQLIVESSSSGVTTHTADVSCS